MFGAGEFFNSFRCGVQFAIRAVLFALAVSMAPVSLAGENGESEFRQHRIAEVVPRIRPSAFHVPAEFTQRWWHTANAGSDTIHGAGAPAFCGDRKGPSPNGHLGLPWKVLSAFFPDWTGPPAGAG